MRRYSRYRDWKRRTVMGVKPSEDNLHLAILQTLNLMPETFAYRTETRGLPVMTKMGWRVKRNPLEVGKADLAVCTSGRSLVLEVKMPGETAEPHQFEWLQTYEMRGRGRAFVVHSVDEAETAVRIVRGGSIGDCRCGWHLIEKLDQEICVGFVCYGPGCGQSIERCQCEKREAETQNE